MLRLDSILARILWLHIAALTLAAIAVPLASYLVLNETANNFEHKTLRIHAAKIAAYLSQSSNGRLRIALPPDLQDLYDHGFDGFAFSVVDAKGEVLFTSLRKGRTFPNSMLHTESASYFNHPEGNAVYYGAAIPQQIGGHTIWIEVAQNMDHPDVIIDDIVASFLRRIAWFTIPILLLVIAVDVLAVRHALRPVLNTSDEARAISPRRIDVRLSGKMMPREIRPLVEAFNQALDRLERGFRTQREFTADAAHELRTPLAVLRARIDALPDRELADPLKRDVAVMARIVEQLLEVAELETTLLDTQEVFDLQTTCAHVVEHLGPMAAKRDMNIRFVPKSGPVLVRGSADLLFRAVRNLTENAIKYSSPSATIEVAVDASGVVTVADEGPGVPENERQLIFRRFWRRERSSRDGAGLGLAIVSQIVAAHGGRIEVKNGRERGAIFSIVLPLVPVAPT